MVVLGLVILQVVYEVGLEFYDWFFVENLVNLIYFYFFFWFGYYMFDLQCFIMDCLSFLGFLDVIGLGICIYVDEDCFFFYWWIMYRGEFDYGWQISVIMIDQSVLCYVEKSVVFWC